MNAAAAGWRKADGRTRASRPGTAGAVLRWGRDLLAESGDLSADLDAQLLLADALGMERWRLFSAQGVPVGEEQWRSYRELVGRRADGAPLAYLLRKKEFWSLDLFVEPGVLVPRPETEIVVETALERLLPGARIVDVGTGSGNILAAVGKELDGDGWVGIDISAAALKVARANIFDHGLSDRVQLVQSDLFGGIRDDAPLFDAVLSNPPYIKTSELPLLPVDVRCHEPGVALDGGDDGLSVIKRLLGESSRRLKEGGLLIVEVGDGQASDVAREALGGGLYGEVETRRDLAGRERVVVARRR